MGKETETKQRTVENANSTSQVNYPDWFHEYQQDLAERASENVDRKVPSYNGQLVANFSPDQQAAYTWLRNYLPESVLQEALGGAQAYAGAPAQQLSPEYGSAPAQHISTERIVDQGGRLGSLQDYFNPFTQYTLDPTLRQIQGAGDETQKRVNMLASGAGRAFGDARHGILESENRANTQTALGDATFKAYGDAWDKGMALRRGDQDLFYRGDLANAGFNEAALERLFKGDVTQAGFNEQALKRLLEGTGAMQTRSAADQAQQLQLLQAKLSAGAQQTAQEQQRLAAQYGEFLRKYSGDQDKLKMYAAIINSMNPEKTVKGTTSGTSTTTTSQPDNSWAQLAGSILGAALAPATGGASLLTPLASGAAVGPSGIV